MSNRRGHGAGAIRALPSGRYQARVRFQGALVSAPQTFDTRGDANAWLKQAQRRIAKGLFQPPEKATARTAARKRPETMTLRQHSDRFLADRDLKPRTAIEYRGLLDRHIVPTLGDLPVGEIDPADVRAWYAQCAPGKPSTRAKAYSLLKTILAQLADDEVIDRNPCRIKNAGTAKTTKTATIVSPEQLEDAAAAMPDDLALAPVLAAYAGLRLGEVLGLQRRDIDGGAVVIRRTAVQVTGGTVEGTPKSDAGRRTIAIPAGVAPMVAAHLAAHTAADPDAWLFPARHKTAKPLAASTFYRHWYTARDAAGIPGVPFHDLRHTGATWAAQSGASVAEIMRRVGHTTPRMALHYVAATDDRDRAVADALPTSRRFTVIDGGAEAG